MRKVSLRSGFVFPTLYTRFDVLFRLINFFQTDLLGRFSSSMSIDPLSNNSFPNLLSSSSLGFFLVWLIFNNLNIGFLILSSFAFYVKLNFNSIHFEFTESNSFFCHFSFIRVVIIIDLFASFGIVNILKILWFCVLSHIRNFDSWSLNSNSTFVVWWSI